MTIPEDEKEFVDQMLLEHNTRRKMVSQQAISRINVARCCQFQHSAPNLECSEELSEMAQQWADKLAKQVLYQQTFYY